MPAVPPVTSVVIEYMSLYSQGKIQEAFDYLTAIQDCYPDSQAELVCYRACMASALGRNDLAFELLETGARSGAWYHEAALLHDPDFAGLQGDPRLLVLHDLFKVRRERAIIEAKPGRLVLEPQGFDEPRPLLLTLHGANRNMREFAPCWMPAVDQGWRVAMLQSSQVSWMSGAYIWEDEARALAEVRRHYAELCGQYDIDPGRLVIAGFSAGGAIAARAALEQAIPASGFIAMESFSTQWDQPGGWEKTIASAGSQAVRVAVQCGKLDEHWLEGARRFMKLLERGGIQAKLFETENTAHGIPSEFDRLQLEMLEYTAL